MTDKDEGRGTLVAHPRMHAYPGNELHSSHVGFAAAPEYVPGAHREQTREPLADHRPGPHGPVHASEVRPWAPPN